MNDLQDILQQVRTFMQEKVLPLETPFLAQGFAAIRPQLQALRQEVKTMGLWTPHLPPEFGGVGLDLHDFAHLSEALGMSPLGHWLFNCHAPDIGNMELLHLHGNAEQQERFLLPLARGDIHSCFAMTEPEHAGSNPVWMSTTAVKDGEDYVINGHKWLVTAADGADFAVVMAVTDPEAPRHRRASMFLVPTDTPGYEHVRRIPIMGEEGEDYFSHSELRFHDCRVPRSALLGEEGDGFMLAQQRLGPGRIHHTMRWIGISQRALEMMGRYALSRELAPGRPLADMQTVQTWIAESQAEIQAARLLVMDAAAKLDAHGSKAARVEISQIKFFVAGVLQRVLDRAIQVHGGYGLTDYTLLSFWYRHERGARIYDGPDEVHKRVVARHVLRALGG